MTDVTERCAPSIKRNSCGFVGIDGYYAVDTGGATSNASVVLRLQWKKRAIDSLLRLLTVCGGRAQANVVVAPTTYNVTRESGEYIFLIVESGTVILAALVVSYSPTILRSKGANE